MSDLPWFRMYSDCVDNEKLRLLAFEDRWHYVAMLALKQQGIMDSNPILLERKIAVKLGVQLRELDEIKRRLIEVELIDEDFQPVGWGDHQFSSDSDPTAKERKQRQREKQRNNKKIEPVTDMSRVTVTNVTRTEEDTDTHTELNTERLVTTDRSRIKDNLEGTSGSSIGETQVFAESKPKKARKKFIKPTLAEIEAYCRERKNQIDAQAFLDHYESNGWHVGKNPMRDWQAAIRTWERTEKTRLYRNRNGPLSAPERVEAAYARKNAGKESDERERHSIDLEKDGDGVWTPLGCRIRGN